MDPAVESESVWHATTELASWLDRNGIAGWDPYDLLGHPLVVKNRLRLIDNPRTRRLGYRLDALLKRHPLAFRRVLGVRPEVNAKGCGLLLSGWSRASALGLTTADANAHVLADWIVNNPSVGYPGVAWGYPFDWQSRVFIPRGTPSAVVTATCGHGLLDYFDRYGDESVLPAARGAAEFLSTGLNRYEDSEGRVCLSYTPVDDFQVHNANLMAAEYLLRASKLFDVRGWESLADSCAAFTLSQQRDDGSFDYWSDAQSTSLHVDNYHTGFVLRSLSAFADAGHQDAAAALATGWEYYRDVLVRGPGEPPRDLPDIESTLNIHSCAESVLCPAVMAPKFPEALGLAEAKAEWAVNNMRNEDGSFAYVKEGERITRIPYLRWSQAWMFRALTELAGRKQGPPTMANRTA